MQVNIIKRIISQYYPKTNQSETRCYLILTFSYVERHGYDAKYTKPLFTMWHFPNHNYISINVYGLHSCE